MELNYIITITDRSLREELEALYANCGLHMVLSEFGHGTATMETLSRYGLTATEKVIVSAVAVPEAAAQLTRAAKRRMMLDIPGHGIMMSIPMKSVGGGKTLAYLTDNKTTGGTPDLGFSHELIVVILNEGYSDNVMDAAREAGARGGTVMHAKGTGKSRGERFFGVSLADEKDVIYIVADREDKAGIMRAINEKTGPGTPSGAICFSLPVTSVVGLRQKDED